MGFLKLGVTIRGNRVRRLLLCVMVWVKMVENFGFQPYAVSKGGVFMKTLRKPRSKKVQNTMLYWPENGCINCCNG